MLVKKSKRRWISMAVILSMLLALLPIGVLPQAEASSEDQEVRVGTALIGNLSHEAENTLLNFYTNQTGFSYSKPDSVTIDFGPGDIFNTAGTTVTFQIRVADNEVLRNLALSEHAQVDFGFSSLAWTRECVKKFIVCLDYDYQATKITMKADNTQIYAEAYHGGVGARSATATITPNTVITVKVEGYRDRTSPRGGVRGMYIKFKDKTRPYISNYTFTGNGAERYNNITGQTELYVKQNENITLRYNFNENIRPNRLESAFHDHFLRHPLFTNPNGTGLPAQGEPQYLRNTTYHSGNLKSLQKSINYTYVGQKWHHSGNLPLEPKLTGASDGGSPLDWSLEEKFSKALLTDAAGNAVRLVMPNRASGDSNSFLRNKTVNPFHYSTSGYRVIVDAVAPKYSKTGNGVQPEIVTGVVLNKDDTIDFTVQFTEEAVGKVGWDVNKTFLHFNNGMKAYYVKGANTSKWTFRAKVEPGVQWETPLLKVIALTHDNKPQNSDIDVVQDYAGNMLIQPANFFGEHRDGDVSNVNSKIDWATLSIDNTPPVIDYRFENGGATNLIYRKNGKVTIDANDANLIIPALEPVMTDRGKVRPSNGIYRPSNMTGAQSPSVGLVYYYWSSKPQNPFASKSGDHYAAIKRYSLSAKQPYEELYPDEDFMNVQLQVVNNKTNMISPPPEALLPGNSGIWYLHTWTADMSWDSARELMQYEKMKTYIQRNPAQYEAWKREPSQGSDSDRTTYANNKALVAVGQYANIEVWPLSDFTKDDSNWTYNVGTLRLDNQVPAVSLVEINGDQTANVSVTAELKDPHSGIQQSFYQWVKAGEAPKDIDWKAITLLQDRITLASRHDLNEDGPYELYIRAVDHAGNQIVKQVLNAPITVNSSDVVQGSFTSLSGPDTFRASHDVGFVLTGLASDPSAANYGVNVGYRMTNQSIRSTNPADYTALTAIDYNADLNSLMYTIPADNSKNGIQYVHIRAQGDQSDKIYYYTRAFKWDNEAPVVTFSRSGVSYPTDLQTVNVTVQEPYSKDGLYYQHQWVKVGDPIPDADAANWIMVPPSGNVSISGNPPKNGASNTDAAVTTADLQPGDMGDYRLYVLAVDGSGNKVVTHTTGFFKISRPGGKDVPPAAAKSDLISLYGDETDGYTAIIKLELDTVDKRGYEFSVSPDNGVSWVKWRPYTNFVAIKVPTGKPEALRIQVKFRTPGGAIGEPVLLGIQQVLPEDPVYAVASLSTTRPVNKDQGVEIQVTPPLGIRVVASDVNPTMPTRSGNRFLVKESGYYTFDLTDMNDTTRVEKLYVVVSNIDNTPPEGSIQYLSTAPTNGNVTVKLETSEPVQVINNEGRFTYTFTQNGSFTFKFQDEAGNVGEATAVVTNIDKNGPDVEIIRSYIYGDNGEKTFGTLYGDNGQVLFSSGVTLVLQKKFPWSKDYLLMDGKDFMSINRNGTYSFAVVDLFGNVTLVKEEVTTIVSEPPKADHIEYSFINENGDPIPEEEIVTIKGRPYARGKMKVTVTGQTEPQNPVFSGTGPITVEGQYTNQVSDEEGSFSYSRIFSAEGSTVISISDALGNVARLPVTVQGLDNTAPMIELKRTVVPVLQKKANFNFVTDLGGYTVTDNISDRENISVTISGLDLNKLGRQRVIYTARDQVGNIATVDQEVYVVNGDGMQIFANDILLSGGTGETALFDTNTLTFTISKFNIMKVGGVDRVNEWGTYDIYIQSGLYREGQMKQIASKLTYQELVSRQFKVKLDTAGWYTIIVRNQEREREYGSFFVSKVSK